MSFVSFQLEPEVIQKHIEMYEKVTGLSCCFINEQGETVYAGENSPQFCVRFREATMENCPCSQAHLYASKQSEKLGEPYVFFCPGGMVHWTAAIVVKEIFRGALLAGPVQMNLPDDFAVDEILKSNQLEIAKKGVLNASMKMIPVVEPERVRHLAGFLGLLAKDIMVEECKLFSERKRFYEEQASLNEEIQEIKEKEKYTHISEYYPVELEKELVARVKRGDKKGAKNILNELLGHVLFQHGGNLQTTKARVLELMVVLSRAAVEGGGDLEMIFGMNLQYIHRIQEIEDVESLCKWIVEILERFTDSVYKLEDSNNALLMQEALAYINEQYMNELSLENAAEKVYLSTSYFSRLFKKEMGINFSDYLNKVRIEASKKYLLEVKLPLSEVAHKVGFTDQSYYTKVFRKMEGVSPGQFRKMIL